MIVKFWEAEYIWGRFISISYGTDATDYYVTKTMLETLQNRPRHREIYMEDLIKRADEIYHELINKNVTVHRLKRANAVIFKIEQELAERCLNTFIIHE